MPEQQDGVVYGGSRSVFIKTFYSSGGSCIAVERKYCREFVVHVAPSGNTIYRIVKQFGETASVSDKLPKGQT
jgi:hypothetical protein